MCASVPGFVCVCFCFVFVRMIGFEYVCVSFCVSMCVCVCKKESVCV